MNEVGEGAARQDARDMRDRTVVAVSGFGCGNERSYETGAKTAETRSEGL